MARATMQPEQNRNPFNTKFFTYCIPVLLTFFIYYFSVTNSQSDLVQITNYSPDEISLSLDILTLHEQILGNKNEPVLFKLIAQDIDLNRIQNQAPLDISCVIDVSGSMQGKKLELVKDSLKVLLEYLRPQDRLTLVSFSSSAQLLINGFALNEDKRQAIRIIDSLEAQGGTNIPSGMKIALERIAQMDDSESTFGIFLLSDGQNNNGRISYIQDYINSATFKNDFIINTYGFGNDHDPIQMSEISNYKQGTFSFIDKLDKVDEYFVNAIATLTTIQYSQVNITVQLSEGIDLKKVYGNNIEIQTNKNASIHLKNLIGGVARDFLFEIGINYEEQTDDLFIDAKIEAKNKENKWERKQLRIDLKYDEKESEKLKNKDVEIQLIRLKGTEILEQALGFANEGQFGNCKEILKGFMDEYGDRLIGELQILKHSMKNGYDNCEPMQYERMGRAYMTQKSWGFHDNGQYRRSRIGNVSEQLLEEHAKEKKDREEQGMNNEKYKYIIKINELELTY